MQIMVKLHARSPDLPLFDLPLFGEGRDPAVGGRSRLSRASWTGLPSCPPLPLPLLATGPADRCWVEVTGLLGWRWGRDCEGKKWREFPSSRGREGTFRWHLARQRSAGHLSGCDPLLLSQGGVRHKGICCSASSTRNTGQSRPFTPHFPKMSIRNAKASSVFPPWNMS